MGHLMRSKAFPILAFISQILLVLPIVKADDGSALLDFMRLADPFNASKVWDLNNTTANDYCQWTGVLECDDQKRVVMVILDSIGLNGTLPQDLFARLDRLEVFSLRQNKLRGTIPSLWLAKHLTTLLLDDNELSGPIPTSLASLTNLQEVNLSKNKLNDSLPDSPNFSTLTSFDVSNNNLSGRIPSSLSRFDGSSFQGNNLLCGPPLARTCFDEKVSQRRNHVKEFHWMMLIYIILGVVVAVGLIVAVGIFMCKRERSREIHNAKFSPHSDRGSRNSNFSASDKATRQSVEGAKKSGVSPVDKASRSSFDSIKSKDVSHIDPNKKEFDVASIESFEDKGNLEFIDATNRRFELDDLLKASAEILGRGLLGSSYKATLEGRLEVVVKRLSLINHCEKKAFSETMKALGKINHPNILPLQAHLYAKEEKLLIYDYLPNGSLFNALHTDEGRQKTRLDWLARINIAKGVARAMDYIHTTYASALTPSRSPMCNNRRYMLLHGNLKSSNVLLGPRMEAQVVDFGVAVMLAGTGAQAYLAGNRAPECRGGGPRKLSAASDVYCYGVLLLELLTGKMPMQGFGPTAAGVGPGGSGGIDLPHWVESVIREEWTAEVFDRELAYSRLEEDELVSLLKLAMACVSPLIDQRPSMSLILHTISQDIKSFKELDSSYPSSNPSSQYTPSPDDHHYQQQPHLQYNTHNGHHPLPPAISTTTALDIPSSDRFSFSFESQMSSTTGIRMDSLQR
ncbi:hypothetical protein L7F22_028237 [Adiantum nelumboides]|nr:hypothetical protein [Adiantum nelumboides]